MAIAYTASYENINGIKTISTLLLRSFSEKDTENIGRIIGIVVHDQFMRGLPVHGLYLSGHIGTGKSTLLSGLIQSFDGGSNFSVKELKRPLFHKDNINTYPKILHRDILRDSIQKCLKQTFTNKNEILLMEWADHLPANWMEKDRINAEMQKQKNKTRSIMLAGHGNGKLAIQSIAILAKNAIIAYSNADGGME